ncbi:hypothetical protein MTQ93_09690 [Staphylococcus agnetis]|uniref:hypothetical protein n=1 Tax=Staphylococcus agnetis TaxID=985762 RepID=UPI00208EAF75|nr:hypothetical protein [Staphylococcus agnetis]MCO4346316.1 hypothetical protein [Staphylococcus agnetis]MCO4360608.1 hypothetical protein [Staphylococcus agnetis]
MASLREMSGNKKEEYVDASYFDTTNAVLDRRTTSSINVALTGFHIKERKIAFRDVKFNIFKSNEIHHVVIVCLENKDIDIERFKNKRYKKIALDKLIDELLSISTSEIEISSDSNFKRLILRVT